jgi:predicted nucleotidyltransferase
MTDLTEPLADFVALFQQRRIPYVLMGGLAVAAHGLPRPTHDVDFTIALPRAHLQDFYQAATALGYTVPDAFQGGWVDQVGGLPLVRIQTWTRGKTVDIDVFLAESDYQRELLKRKVRVHVEGLEAWLVTPEDLILLKLIADRPRDYGDIADILFVQGELDEKYLRRWATELGVTDRLERALQDERGP